MSDLAGLEAEVKEFKLQVHHPVLSPSQLCGSRSSFNVLQLETVQSSLQVDPDNTELQSLKTELEELITLTETSIAELKPPAPAPKPDPTPVKKSWSKEPVSRRPAVTSHEEISLPSVSFSVNDNVLARWVSGDNAFYPARITSITGSSSNPVYLVSFKSYATVENLTAKDIRPLAGNDSRKRKVDGTSGSSASPSPTPPAPNVISAAADINPTLASQARKEPSTAGDGQARPAKVPRKVKATKELEEGKNKWKDFAAKSKGKFGKKESMFRTGEGVNARGMLICSHGSHSLKYLHCDPVGFTGSGQQMRKDPTRTRHIYQQADEEGY